jgi:PPP family 3-phenylpropionic acid transporter
MVAPKGYYFCFFAAMASLIPYLVLYYRQAGLSGSQIGMLTGIGPFITLVSAPLWGGLADATQRHKALLLVATGAAMAAVLALSRLQSLIWLLPIVAAYGFFSAPIMPLVDNSVLALLGERKSQYGRQRLWGAVGWGLAGVAFGFLIERAGLQAAFVGFTFFMGTGFLVVLFMRIEPSHIGGNFWAGIRRLAASREWAVFLLTVLIAGVASGITNSFLFLHLQDMGASSSLMGMSLLVATISEIPIFFYSDRLLRRWGAHGLLSMSLLAFVIRLLGYAIMPRVWFVLPIHLLHGLTFSAMWVAGVSYANELAPPGMGATAQGLFGGVMMGLGAATGAVVGGILYDRIGPRNMFAGVAFAVTAGLVAFWIAGRRQPVPQAPIS